MTAVNYGLRTAFAKPVTCFVKITPQGFLLSQPGLPLAPEFTSYLIGRVAKVQLLRKRLEDNVPV